jgi:hypothetical protein
MATQGARRSPLLLLEISNSHLSLAALGWNLLGPLPGAHPLSHSPRAAQCCGLRIICPSLHDK